MGWTFETNHWGYTPKQFWVNQYVRRLEADGRFKVVAQNSKSKDFYAAVKNLENGKTFGLIVLIEKHGNEIGYKEMDESCHPYYYGATKKVIESLSPTESEYANEWRKNCLNKFKS